MAWVQNQLYVKKKNTLTVLDLIAQSQLISRKELADMTGMSPAGITRITGTLISHRLVRRPLLPPWRRHIHMRARKAGLEAAWPRLSCLSFSSTNHPARKPPPEVGGSPCSRRGLPNSAAVHYAGLAAASSWPACRHRRNEEAAEFVVSRNVVQPRVIRHCRFVIDSAFELRHSSFELARPQLQGANMEGSLPFCGAGVSPAHPWHCQDLQARTPAVRQAHGPEQRRRAPQIAPSN